MTDPDTNPNDLGKFTGVYGEPVDPERLLGIEALGFNCVHVLTMTEEGRVEEHHMLILALHYRTAHNEGLNYFAMPYDEGMDILREALERHEAGHDH